MESEVPGSRHMILLGHTEIGEARISRLFAIKCQIERVGVDWSGVGCGGSGLLLYVPWMRCCPH